MSSKTEPKFYAVDALDAYPEPVGTDDKLELNQEMGAVYVHLNYKRAKLVGLQSLDFLIRNLELIRVEALGPRIAAPVVERQPFRYLVQSCYGPTSKRIEDADESMRDSIESARQYFGVEHELDAEKAKSLVYISPGEWFAIPLYTSPPELAELQIGASNPAQNFQDVLRLSGDVQRKNVELAELQATIARLTAENERLGLVEKESLQRSWQAGYDTGFYAKNPAHERERLKGGQGEPVAWVDPYALAIHSESEKQWVRISASLSENRVNGYTQPLYTSQPAPVSVINENAAFEDWRKEQIASLVRMGYPDAAKAFRDLGSVQWAGWQARAYLDKVKELNQ